MPKIRRRNLPDQLFLHLVERLEQRQISTLQLRELSIWLATNPTVPEGRWFKQFASFSICGEGELVKTFLLPGQLPNGTEIP